MPTINYGYVPLLIPNMKLAPSTNGVLTMPPVRFQPNAFIEYVVAADGVNPQLAV
jgi:hypothetical protein